MQNGFTPVQYANQNGHVEVELLLIENNAYNPPEVLYIHVIIIHLDLEYTMSL